MEDERAEGWEEPKALTDFIGPEITTIIEKMIPAAQITLFAAKAKAGKTTFLAHLLRSMETGEDFCGLRVQKAKAVILSEEPEGIWEERVEALKLTGWHYGKQCHKHTLEEWETEIERLRHWMNKEGFRLLVIDTMANIAPVKDENNNSEVAQFMDALKKISMAGIGVLIFWHHRHAGMHARGASAIQGYCDVIINLKHSDHSSRARKISVTGRSSELIAGFEAELDHDRYVLVDGTMGKPETTVKETIKRLASKTIWTVDDYLKNWPEQKKPDPDTVRNALAKLASKGFLECTLKGNRSRKSKYRLSAQV